MEESEALPHNGDEVINTEAVQPKEAPPSSENYSKERRSQGNGSQEMTTAMGGTLDQDLEHAMLGDEKESEENIKDTLNNKILELEVKLKQTNDYYDRLSHEVVTAKSLYEKEQEECEDVVSVAKRNIEGQVAKILELQTRKRTLAAKIEQEEQKLKQEEDNTRVQLKSEEERLTRNVVILQTKLLINEGIKFERDQLLSKIKCLEGDLVEKEDYYQEQLRIAKTQIQEKYNRLYQIANEHKGSISEQVKNLSLRQQIGALKHAQEQVVSTQTVYKKASRNLLKMLDQNKVLSRKNHDMDVDVNVQNSLTSALAEISDELKKDQELDSVTEKDETEKESKDLKEVHESLLELNRKIEDFKNQFHKGKDEEDELIAILNDQKSYLRVVTDQKEKIHAVEQRLIPLADVAETIANRGAVDMKEDFEEPAMRYEMFQKLSAIITESEALQKYLDSAITKSEAPESEIFSTPSPFAVNYTESGKRNSSSGLHVEHNVFTRHLDKTEKKILSELSLLGKYGNKSKKLPCF